MNETIIYLKPNRRKKFAQSFGHVLPGIILILSGMESVLPGDTKHLAFAALSILSGAAVVISFILEMRRSNEEHHHGVNWFDIFAGIVLFVEAFHKYSPEKGFQPAHLYVLAGVLTIIKGMFHARLPSSTRLTCTKEGLFARTSPFRSLKLSWHEIASVQVSHTAIMITTKSGERRKIGLRNVENKTAVNRFITEHWLQYIDQSAQGQSVNPG